MQVRMKGRIELAVGMALIAAAVGPACSDQGNSFQPLTYNAKPWPPLRAGILSPTRADNRDTQRVTTSPSEAAKAARTSPTLFATLPPSPSAFAVGRLGSIHPALAPCVPRACPATPTIFRQSTGWSSWITRARGGLACNIRETRGLEIRYRHGNVDTQSARPPV